MSTIHIIPKRPLKNRHWLEFSEYISIVGVATGAVASFVAKQTLYLSAPLSIALLVGLANRRRLESLNEKKIETSVATLRHKLSKQIRLVDQHVQTLPTSEMVGDVRNSTLRHSRDEFKQLTSKIDSIEEVIAQHSLFWDEQQIGAIRNEVEQLQGFYTEIDATLKRVQQTVDNFDSQSAKSEIEMLVTQLREETNQLQTRFQFLSDQTQPVLSSLQEQVDHLSYQSHTILQQVDANLLKRELDIVMDAVAELAPKRELMDVIADVQILRESQDAQEQSEEVLRQQLQTVMQQFQLVPDNSQLQTQIEEMLSWRLRTIHQQLQTLSDTRQFQDKVKEVLGEELDTINHQLQEQLDHLLYDLPYRLIFDLSSGVLPCSQESGTIPVSGSRQLLDEALSTAQHRLILIWPWSIGCQMDKPLMQGMERFVKSGRRLEVGWCHIINPKKERYLGSINRRWSLDPLRQRSLRTTLKFLLVLKRRYPRYVKFRVMGTVDNFLVADHSFAALGIENRLTTKTATKDISLKLWTSDRSVIQQLIQIFEDEDLDSEDVESHWNRAITRYDLGDRVGAMADLEKVLALTPTCAMAYNMRGIIRYEQQDSVGALDDFDRSLTLDPAQMSVYCNRGFVRAEQGDQYRAIADFSLAIQAGERETVGTQLGLAHFYRGLACQKLDDFDGAIADYTRALTHIPHSPIILYHRGLIYQTLTQLSLAAQDLKQAVTLFQSQGTQSNARRADRHLAEVQHLIDTQVTDTQVVDTQTAQAIDTQIIDTHTVQGIDIQGIDTQVVDTQIMDAQSGNDRAIDAQSRDLQVVDSLAMDVQAQKQETTNGHCTSSSLFEDVNDQGSKMPVVELSKVVSSESNLVVGISEVEEIEKVEDYSEDNVDVTNFESMDIETLSYPVPAPEILSMAALPPSTEQSVPTARRRRKTDIDQLVTSTLTNFFNKLDLQKIGERTLEQTLCTPDTFVNDRGSMTDVESQLADTSNLVRTPTIPSQSQVLDAFFETIMNIPVENEPLLSSEDVVHETPSSDLSSHLFRQAIANNKTVLNSDEGNGDPEAITNVVGESQKEDADTQTLSDFFASLEQEGGDSLGVAYFMDDGIDNEVVNNEVMDKRDAHGGNNIVLKTNAPNNDFLNNGQGETKDEEPINIVNIDNA